MDVLHRIKRLVASGQYRATFKAESELFADDLEVQDAVEAILNSSAIKRVLRFRSALRDESSKKLYVIEGCNYAGTFIYTKGAIKRKAGVETYYLFISSKISAIGD